MANRLSLRELMVVETADAIFLHPLPTRSSGLNVPVEDTNAAACELLGYSANELCAIPLGNLLDPQNFQDSHLETLSQKGKVCWSGCLIASDGRAIPVDTEMHLVTMQDTSMCLIIARDVSEQRQLEAELAKTRDELESANQVKHQFLANMSHELRTPLNGLMGMTQILLGTKLTSSQREYLSLSQDAAHRLTKVLTDLLALSSVEAGSLETVQAPFDLRQTLEGLVTPLTHQAADKSLILSMTIHPEVPAKVIGDASKLAQILINLLANAIRFTNEGEVALTVTPTPPQGRDGEASHLDFIVSDTGIGIDEQRLETIFESFALGEDYLTKEYGGAGLGLAISRQLAEAMDGAIGVESEPGKGSIFTLTLPFDAVADTRPTRQSTEAASALNILLAEDEQVNSIMASRLLKKEGHSVTVVGNGQQAIEALARTPFDLVLMDVQMPVVNGIQATQIIRGGGVENVSRDLPIIGLTAFGRATEKNQFLKAGMNSVVTKPFEMADLIGAISTVVP